MTQKYQGQDRTQAVCFQCPSLIPSCPDSHLVQTLSVGWDMSVSQIETLNY